MQINEVLRFAMCVKGRPFKQYSVSLICDTINYAD